MNVEMINDDIVEEYLDLLTSEEVFGCSNGRISCFGAYDEDTGEPMGVLTAEIFPEYIRIKRIYVRHEFADEGVDEALIDIVTDLPDEARLPIYMFGTENEIDPEFLEDNGFEKVPSKYSYIEGKLGDYISVAASLGDGELKTLNQVPAEELEKYVFKTEHDAFMQIPEDYLDTEKFSEVSLVMLKKRLIEGAILLEEEENYIYVPYIQANDNKLLLYAFFILKKLLFTEFEPEDRIRFLICDGKGREALTRIIRNCEEYEIGIYRFSEMA